jgi:hypothetical protein
MPGFLHRADTLLRCHAGGDYRWLVAPVNAESQQAVNNGQLLQIIIDLAYKIIYPGDIPVKLAT